MPELQSQYVQIVLLSHFLALMTTKMFVLVLGGRVMLLEEETGLKIGYFLIVLDLG